MRPLVVFGLTWFLVGALAGAGAVYLALTESDLVPQSYECHALPSGDGAHPLYACVPRTVKKATALES